MGTDRASCVYSSLLGKLTLHGQGVWNLFEGDLSRPIDFNAEKERASFFCLENARLFSNNVEYSKVTHTLVHKGDVDGSWELLVDTTKLFH